MAVLDVAPGHEQHTRVVEDVQSEMVRRPAFYHHREERVQEFVVLREVVGVGPGVEPRRRILTFAEEPGEAFVLNTSSDLAERAGAHPERAHAQYQRVRREDFRSAARRLYLLLPEVELRRERRPDVYNCCGYDDLDAVQRRGRPVEGAEI